MRDFRKALDNAVLRKAEANREVVPCLVVAVGVTGLHGRDLDRYRDERLVPIAELGSESVRL